MRSILTETLALLSVDKGTKDTVSEKIKEFQFTSLWLSGLINSYVPFLIHLLLLPFTQMRHNINFYFIISIMFLLLGIASGLSLCIAQYSAFKIQHEHDTTLMQRLVYFVSCVFNTITMMTTCVMFITVLLIPVVEYIGR